MMDDMDTKQELPIHVILGASEYARLKTSSVPRDGNPGEPVAELTSFGWTIMSPGAETNLSSVYLTRSSSTAYGNCAALMYWVYKINQQGNNRQCTANSKSNLCVIQRGGMNQAFCGKLATHPSLTTELEASGD